MKHGGKMLACMMGGLALCTAARAVTPDTSETSGNPYQSIIDRNVFGLKPPPPPPDLTETVKPQTLKITLTGITTILGNKRVLMKTPPPPNKPGEPPKTEQSYILTEGQREGDIEVIEIDEKAGSVKVNNAGTVQTLTFEKDGAKLPATQAPAGVPGVPPVNGAIPGLPVTRPQMPVPGATPNFQLPTRIPRLPTPGATASGVTPTGITPSFGTPGVVLPGNTAFQNTASPVQTPVPGATPANPYSPEEQAILIEANRQAGGPTASLLPPTPLNPRANVDLGPESPTAQNPRTPTITLPPLPGRPTAPGPY